ncbi:MAG TPA: protein-methionine-sulfoxide reductase heme-binding subunit MsrQ [Gemmatimonadales bacterium]|nr:protein-methionine-sulfoxide reductase heme-binding subunit MsrQ [Gemmatimonadales bacterium]
MAALLGAAFPLAWLVRGILASDLGPEPVDTIQRWTGLPALTFLWLSLAVTPLRRLWGLNTLIRLRKPLGLAAYGYAVLHLLSYVVFDQELSVSEIVKDIIEHPWVLVGFSAFLLLTPLALTSTEGAIRRLGGRRWQQLHRLVYPAAILASLHFLWLVKRDVTLPVAYLVVLALLLGSRLLMRRARGAAPRASAARS